MEYTYADVIIDPNDPRVEIGAEYYRSDYPKRVLKHASNDNDLGTLEEIDNESPETPFIVRTGSALSTSPWACLIRKKEPVKKYVPFDLNDPEVRKSLRGRWIKADCGEYQISGFRSIDGEDGEEWEVAVAFGVISSKNLFDRWTFEDGSKCGKLVEEE